MTDHNDKTKPTPAEFDFSAFPANTLFHERRTGRRPARSGSGRPAGAPQSRARGARLHGPRSGTRQERRRRIDPTTFEKQYTDDELEFMNAMQRFKERTGKPFPTHGEVIKVAVSLGYRKRLDEECDRIRA